MEAVSRKELLRAVAHAETFAGSLETETEEQDEKNLSSSKGWLVGSFLLERMAGRCGAKRQAGGASTRSSLLVAYLRWLASPPSLAVLHPHPFHLSDRPQGPGRTGDLLLAGLSLGPHKLAPLFLVSRSQPLQLPQHFHLPR